MKQSAGFTLIELITVMVIVGILAVFAAPRMFDANAFKSRGFADQVLATLHYAQKIAIAQRRNVCVALTSSTISLTIANSSGAGVACGSSLALPAGGNSITSPTASITLTYTLPGTFTFDALGKTPAAQTITVYGETPIIVEAETGYVHSP